MTDRSAFEQRGDPEELNMGCGEVRSHVKMRVALLEQTLAGELPSDFSTSASLLSAQEFGLLRTIGWTDHTDS